MTLGFFSLASRTTPMKERKIAVLDAEGIKPQELDLSVLDAFGQVTIYQQTHLRQAITERARDSDILIVNKVRLQANTLDQLDRLKLICITATGHDNIDIEFCQKKGIAVYNVKGYGTESVAQHVLAMMLMHCNRINLHASSVRSGEWARRGTFAYSLIKVEELKSKTLGIVGYGNIGQRVGVIASTFGMKILIPDRGKHYGDNVEAVSFDTLIRQSDFVTLHAPLTQQTRKMVGESELIAMKPSAVLINTGRGALIDEQALASALQSKQIAAAYLDVLSQEPPHERYEHPLVAQENCFITPHMAWHSIQARQRLLDATCLNMQSFIDGTPNSNRLV